MSIAKTSLTRTVAAALFGVQVDELRPVFGTKRSLALADAAQGYARLLSEPQAEAIEVRTESAEQKRELLVAQAETGEIRITLIDGTAFRSEDVEATIGTRLSACAGKLRNLGPKTALRVVGKDRETIEATLAEEISEALGEIIPFDRKDFTCDKLFFSDDQESNGNGH